MMLSLYASNLPTTDLLHDPFVLTILAAIIAIFAAVLGSIITIWYTGRQGRKEVVYNIISDTPILSLEKEIGNQVEVHFNNQIVINLRLIIAEVWNAGYVAIPPEEFISPITFSLASPATILDTEIVKKEPNSLDATLQRTSNSVILEPLLLNKNSKVRLKILVSGAEDIIVTSGIVGVELANYSEIVKSRKKIYTRVSITLFWLGLIMLVFGFIFIGILGLISSQTNQTIPVPGYILLLIVGGLVLSFFSRMIIAPGGLRNGKEFF